MDASRQGVDSQLRTESQRVSVENAGHGGRGGHHGPLRLVSARGHETDAMGWTRLPRTVHNPVRTSSHGGLAASPFGIPQGKRRGSPNPNLDQNWRNLSYARFGASSRCNGMVDQSRITWAVLSGLEGLDGRGWRSAGRIGAAAFLDRKRGSGG